jgi:hypothetical protein
MMQAPTSLPQNQPFFPYAANPYLPPVAAVSNNAYGPNSNGMYQQGIQDSQSGNGMNWFGNGSPQNGMSMPQFGNSNFQYGFGGMQFGSFNGFQGGNNGFQNGNQNAQ